MTDATALGDRHGSLTLLGRSIPSEVFALLQTAAQGCEGPRLETVKAAPGLVKASAMIEALVSWCPVTHQIDYYLPPTPGRGGVEITYGPRDKLVESKSLKQYGEWYLTRAIFAESLAVEIANDVHAATDAHWVRVEVHQATRGGIRLAGEACLPVEAPADEAETAAADPSAERAGSSPTWSP